VKLESVDTESAEFQNMKKTISEKKPQLNEEEGMITEEKIEDQKPLYRQ
jgi:hypothetical protein